MNADQDFVLATSSSRSSAPAPLRDASERLVQSLLDHHHHQDENTQEENTNDVEAEDPHDRSRASTGSSLFQTVLSVAKEEAFGSSSSLSPPPPINSKTTDRLLLREQPKVDDFKRVLGGLGISPTRNYGKTTITKNPSNSLAINSSLDVPSLTSTASNTISKPPLSPSSAQHEEGPQPFQRSSRVERPLHKSPLRKARSTGERVSSNSVTTTHSNNNKAGESRPSANGLRKTHSTNGVTTATSSRRKMDESSRRRSERRMGEDSSNRRSERRTMKDDSHRRQAPAAAMDDSSRRRSERRLAKDESERRLAKDDSGRRIAMKDESSSSRRRHTHNVSSLSRREATRKIVSKTSGTAVAASAENEAATTTTRGTQAPRMEDGSSNRRSTATRREGRRRIRKTESTSALESRSSRRSASKSPVLKPNPSSSAATTASSPKTPTRPRRTGTGSVEGRRRRGPHKQTSLSALPPLTLARAVSDPVAAMVDHHHYHHAEANMDGSAPDQHHTRYNMAEEPTTPDHPQHRISNNGNSSTSRRERRTPRKSPLRSASSATTTTTTTSRQRSPMRRNPQDVMQNQLAQVVLNTTDPLERVLSKTDDGNDHDLPLLDPADVEQQQRHKESLHKTLDNLRKGTFNNNGDSKQSAAPNNNSNGWRLFPVTGTSVGIPIMSSGLKTTNNNDNHTTTPTPGIKMTEMAASAVESARIAAARVAGVAAGAERTKHSVLRNGNHPTHHQNARAPATVMQDSTSSMDGSLFSFTGLRKHNSDHTRQTTTSSTAAANAGGGGKFVFGRATTGQQSDHVVPIIFGPQLEIPANDDDSVEFF